jgi:hypothetical protein
MDDDDSDDVLVRPTNVIQCINKDGSINLFKYLLYQRYKRRQKNRTTSGLLQIIFWMKHIHHLLMNVTITMKIIVDTDKGKNGLFLERVLIKEGRKTDLLKKLLQNSHRGMFHMLTTHSWTVISLILNLDVVSVVIIKVICYY